MDQPPQFLSLANGSDYLLQRFGRVRTRLALELGDSGDLLHVAAAHADCDSFERLVKRRAELDVRRDTAELATRRLGGVVDDCGHGTGEAQASPESSCDHGEVIGKLLSEAPPLSYRAEAHDHPDDRRNEDGGSED